MDMVMVLGVWAIVGLAICLCFENRDYVNPIWIYQNSNVNIFGAFVLTILFNLIFPIYSLWYWLCKLCTVGRRK